MPDEAARAACSTNDRPERSQSRESALTIDQGPPPQPIAHCTDFGHEQMMRRDERALLQAAIEGDKRIGQNGCTGLQRVPAPLGETVIAGQLRAPGNDLCEHPRHRSKAHSPRTMPVREWHAVVAQLSRIGTADGVGGRSDIPIATAVAVEPAADRRVLKLHHLWNSVAGDMALSHRENRRDSRLLTTGDAPLLPRPVCAPLCTLAPSALILPRSRFHTILLHYMVSAGGLEKMAASPWNLSTAGSRARDVGASPRSSRGEARRQIEQVFNCKNHKMQSLIGMDSAHPWRCNRLRITISTTPPIRGGRQAGDRRGRICGI